MNEATQFHKRLLESSVIHFDYGDAADKRASDLIAKMAGESGKIDLRCDVEIFSIYDHCGQTIVPPQAGDARAQSSQKRTKVKHSPDLPAEVSISETAEFLGCGKDTVLKLVKNGQLPSRIVGVPGRKTTYRIPLKAVVDMRSTYTFTEPPGAARTAPEHRRRTTKQPTEFKHLQKVKDRKAKPRKPRNDPS